MDDENAVCYVNFAIQAGETGERICERTDRRKAVLAAF
ncbi:hypothetical protein [Citrobacter pasteurii]|nr:hypothetical protein [Citrobacter pasteurii]